jgi:predicted nuclease of predicted toxin-antitoxin system
MKFLVDECVGPTVTKWLKQNNYDAISIYDDLSGVSDDFVLKKAFLENRILITSDKDFGEMIFKNKMQHCGIVLLRLITEQPSNKIRVLEAVLKNYAQELFGNYVVVTETTVRIIKLPLS